MRSLTQFVHPRVPVVSTSNESPDRAAPPESDEPVLRWGKTSYLNFSIEVAFEKTKTLSPGVSIQQTVDEYVIRHGSGVQEAKDRDGNVVASSREGLDAPMFNLFYCGEFTEESEETETRGNLTIIKPIENHVSLYVNWDTIYGWGTDVTEVRVGGHGP